MRFLIILTLTFVFISGASFGQSDAITTVILVRHAEKLIGHGKDPGLTEDGIKRAQELSKVLTETNLDAIYSTAYKRTRETVRLLAESKSMTVKDYDPFKLDDVVGLVKKSKGKTILFSGHSNTTPIIINKLLGEEKYKTLDEKDYDNLYIVSFIDIGKAAVVELQYGEISKLIDN